MKVEADNHFKPSGAQIARILEFYGLELEDYRLATSGIENTTLIVRCTKGEYVLRVYRQHKKTDEHIHQEIRFTAFLFEHGVKTPQIVQNKDNGLLTKVTLDDTSWQVVLMEFVQGSHAVEYSSVLCKDMATTQAQIHELSSVFPDNDTGLALTELAERQFIHLINANDLNDARVTDFLSRGKKFRLNLDRSLPKGLCHLDYDKDNILTHARGDITAVLDFDDLAMAPFVVDLAYTLWHVYFYASEDIAQQYLLDYQVVRTLSRLEKSYIQKIMLFRHYVICGLAILEGRLHKTEIDAYVSMEEVLRGEQIQWLL